MRSVVIDVERLRFLNCGLGRFSLHLGEALRAAAASEFRTVFLIPPKLPSVFEPGEHFITARPWRKHSFVRWIRPLMVASAEERRCDLWHVSHQNSKYWPLCPRTPVLLTIHDLNFLHERPASEIPRCVRLLQRRVDRARAIATVSEFSAQQVRDHLDLGDKPLRVIYNGLSAPRLGMSERPSFLPPGPFLFTIGDITAKKNFHVLLDMMEHLPQRRLVIAGRKEDRYGRYIEREVHRRRLGQRVFVPGEVPDTERQWLYENCEAFMFPSIAEGFGLPVIEAMSFGKAVFLAHSTSLPEVGGQCAFYWTSFEPGAMARMLQAGLDRALSEPQLADRCREHASRFSWQRAAQDYLQYYRDLLATPAAPAKSQRQAA